MILLGLGANLASPFGPPRSTLEAALAALTDAGLHVAARAPWYGSHAVPASSQPDFVNGAVEVHTDLAPENLLALLHRIEAMFGRVRGEPNAARMLDLDLLAYDNRIFPPGKGLVLPHPRMHERAFVLAPLHDIAPQWVHPLLHKTVREIYTELDAGGVVWQLPAED